MKRMTRSAWMAAVAAIVLAPCANLAAQEPSTSSNKPSPAALKELSHNGTTLVVGIVIAPVRTALFDKRNKEGTPEGVTVELGTALALQAGLKVEFVIKPNIGDLVAEVAAGGVDIVFALEDAKRKETLAFGPAYFVADISVLVAKHARGLVKNIDDVGKGGVKVICVKGSATGTAAQARWKDQTISPVVDIQAATDSLKAQEADVLVTTGDASQALVPTLDGSVALGGDFFTSNMAIGVLKSHPLALQYITEFTIRAKSSGMIRNAFDHAGLKTLAVAQ